jgi:pimeloyl-ACP methyl ester carboxylesterase
MFFLLSLFSCSSVNKNSPINEKIYLDLGGTKQYVEITGASEDNPILLFVHGGPGWPQTPFLRYFNGDLTKKITLVSWDQRGCGLSYMKDSSASNISLIQIIADAHQLTDYLKSHYHKNKIYLAGFSWGSIVGIKLAQQYPDDYFAYLSISQVLDLNKSIEVSRKWLREQSIAAHDSASLNTIHQLDMHDTSLCKRPLDCFIKHHDLVNKYNGHIYLKKSQDEIDKAMTAYDDYKKYDWMAGFVNTAYKVEPDMFNKDISQIKEIKIPVYFFVGRHDWTLPASITAQFYQELKCPEKEMIWFENSGHEMLEEEASLFNKKVLEKIK